jgi:hypothetical protein
MKMKSIQIMIFLLFFILLGSHGWAEEWISYDAPKTGTRYFEKNSIQNVDKNIVRVWTIKVYTREGKAQDYFMLKQKNQAPESPEMLHLSSLSVDLDCKKNKFKITAFTIYDKEKKALFSAPASMFQWDDVVGDASSGKLKRKVCK